MVRVVIQTFGRVFQTLSRAFCFLLRLQKPARGFEKLGQAFERLVRVC